MTGITISIETTNAAFDPPEIGVLEVARILRHLAHEYIALGEYQMTRSLRLVDINGNTVGYAEYRPA